MSKSTRLEISCQFLAPSREDFAALLEESFATNDLAECYVTKGIITGIEKDVAIVDVGLKVEGRIAAQGIRRQGQGRHAQVGDEVEVYVVRIENRHGRSRAEP